MEKNIKNLIESYLSVIISIDRYKNLKKFELYDIEIQGIGILNQNQYNTDYLVRSEKVLFSLTISSDHLILGFKEETNRLIRIIEYFESINKATIKRLKLYSSQNFIERFVGYRKTFIEILPDHSFMKILNEIEFQQRIEEIKELKGISFTNL